MKKSVIIGLFLIISVFSFAGISAIGCDLSVSLINQDPYPAIQGEEVRLVFQIDGVENPECGSVEFSIIDNYPLTLMPEQQRTYYIESGTFKKDYQSFFLATYKVKVSEDALDGDNPIEIQYRTGNNVAYETKQFDLNVEDTRADFEIYVKEYNPLTRILTLEILNIAESDIEALTLEIANQDNIKVKGSKTNIVGDLDSNDYTTADFEAVPDSGKFNVKLSYTDSIGERRILEKTLTYEPEYFEDRAADQKETPTSTYVILGIIVLLIIYYFWRRYKKKKALQKKLGKK